MSGRDFHGLEVFGLAIVSDDTMELDEVRIESPDPEHWLTMNLTTGEGVIARPEGIEPVQFQV